MMASRAEVTELTREVATLEARLGRGYDVERLDGELLMERADAGWKMLRDQKVGGIDPYDVLVAVVWPSPDAVAAQLERRLDALAEEAA